MSPSTPQTVNKNTTTSFTVTPNATFYTSSVSGCGGTWSVADPTVPNTYTTGNLTADCSVTATFASNVLTIASPTSAALGAPFDVTVSSTPAGAVVTPNTSACGNATWTGTSPTFTFTIPKAAAISACTITFTATNYPPATLSNLPVYNGVLACGDYDDSSGGTRKTDLDPDLDISYSGTPGWALRRGPNKDGSTCVKVNYSCNLTTTLDGDGQPNDIATCTFDKASGQQATFKYVFLWTPVKVGPEGWFVARPKVSWNIANPSTAHTLPDWVPLLGCAIDIFPPLFVGDTSLPTSILPVIPSFSPFTDDANLPDNGGHSWYQPGQTALVCGAGHGWTAVGRDVNLNILMQGYDKVVDESDLLITPR